MDVAWKVLALMSAAVTCQYALHRAVDHIRNLREERRRPASPGDANRSS